MADLYGNIPIQPDKKNRKSAVSPDTSKTREKATGQTTPKKTRGFKKRYILVPFCIFLLLGSYYGLSSLLIPQFIEKRFPQIFHSQTGFNFIVHSVKFNPLDFSLLLNGISITSSQADGSSSNVIDINTLFTDIDFSSLLRNGIVSEKIQIKGASLHLERYGDSSYNISQLFHRYKIPTTGSMEFAELPFLFSLNNVTIEDSSILFNDNVTGKLHKVEKLLISLPTLANFSFSAKHYIQPRFSAVINGSPINLVSEREGISESASKASQTKLSCTLQDLDLPLYANYLPFSLPIEIEQGKADGKLQIAFQPQKDKGIHLSLGFSLQIENSKFQSLDKEMRFSAPLLNIDGSFEPITRDVAINNLLFRDPTIYFSKNVSSDAIKSLSLGNPDKKDTTDIAAKPYSLSLDLLIGDNGRIIFESEDSKKIFHPVQFSVRNYKNFIDRQTKGLTKRSTFRIHGESEDDFSVFTWQGEVSRLGPRGKLEINNLEIDKLLPIISGQSGFSAAGSADIRGELSLGLSSNASSFYSFEQGSILLNSVMFEENRKKWLQSSSVRISPFSLKDGNVSLGNIYLADSKLSISSTTPPAFLSNILASKTKSLQGIDYKGEILVDSTSGKNDPIHFKNVHLQLTNQDKPSDQDQNFALTADRDGGGSLSAKGNVILHPFNGEIEMSCSNMPAQPFLELYIPRDVSVSPQTRVDGKGKFSLKTKQFAGGLIISGGHFTNAKSKDSISFEKASFDNLLLDPSSNETNSSRIVITDYAFNSEDLTFSSAKLSLEGYSSSGNTLKIDRVSSPDSKVSVSALLPHILPRHLGPDFNLDIETGEISGNIASSIVLTEPSELNGMFTLQFSDIKNAGQKSNNITFSMVFDNKSELHGTGSVSANPLASNISLHISDFATKYLQNIADDFSNLPVDSALTGDISVRLPEKLYSGNLEFTQGSLNSHDEAKLLSWKKARLNDFIYSHSPQQLNISTLVLEQPEFFIEPEDQAIPVETFLSLRSIGATKADKTQSISFSQVNIPKIILDQGILKYSDKRLYPPFQTTASEIKGYINNFHLSKSNEPISYDLNGLLQQSPFAMSGQILPGEMPELQNPTFKLTNFPLISLQDQLRTSIDVNLSNEYSNIAVAETEPQSGKLVQLDISPAMNIRSAHQDTALTLALLTSQESEISQTFRFKNNSRPLLTQSINHFQKLIVKSGVSPYLLLPPPYDSLADSSSLGFDPGQTDLSDDARTILSGYSKLLIERPRLKLSLTSLVNPVSDREVLQHKLEEEELLRVKKENEILLQKWQTQQKVDSNAAAQTADGAILIEDIPADKLEAYTPLIPKPQQVPDKMLFSLGRKRLDNVVDFFQTTHNIKLENIEAKQDILQVDDLDSPRITISVSTVNN